ncbi:hypothetical protein TPA0905_55340 [Streptomyces olivaceus]|nr:hypothetical protein TPA0905_55340 [Streptomyces olivaceus]
MEVRDEDTGRTDRPDAGVSAEHVSEVDRFLNSRDAETDVHKW